MYQHLPVLLLIFVSSYMWQIIYIDPNQILIKFYSCPCLRIANVKYNNEQDIPIITHVHLLSFNKFTIMSTHKTELIINFYYITMFMYQKGLKR